MFLTAINQAISTGSALLNTDIPISGGGEMNTGFEMFLLAAQELNFSRAAERAFVTQQCLSDHIKRLEEAYQVVLFQRKPRLRLTQEGEVLLRYLSDMRTLEDSMRKELCDVSAGIRGTMSFGISATRGYIVIPGLVPAFQQRFPNVDIQIHLEDTKVLEPLLLSNKLDIFLGVGASQHALFYRELITQERLYLVISNSLLCTYFPDASEQLTQMFTDGVDLKLFEKIPFVQGCEASTTTHAINQFLIKNNIRLNVPISVSNFDILLKLCRSDRYATITLKYHLRQLIRINRELPPEKRLHVFPIRNLDRKLDIELITHRDIRLPSYVQVFSQMLREFLCQEYVQIDTCVLGKKEM